MSLTAIIFYLFASVAAFAAVMVVIARNPVHAVLYLILAFFNVGGLFVLAGAEFAAMVLIIVYVGAVAVLFLFAVMMLSTDEKEQNQGFMSKFFIDRSLVIQGGVIGGLVFAELVLLLAGGVEKLANISPAAGVLIKKGAANVPANPIEKGANALTNTEALGMVLYTDYAYLFQLAGLILLVAMVGAIMLAYRPRANVKRQNINDQIARSKTECLELVKVNPGEGAK